MIWIPMVIHYGIVDAVDLKNTLVTILSFGAAPVPGRPCHANTFDFWR